MTLEPIIQILNPDTFEYQTYSNSDEQLIVQSELDTVFSNSTDYIEYYVYDQNKNLIFPSSTIPLTNFDIRDGDILLNPSSNLEELGFDVGIYNILYSFYRKRGASSIENKYFISTISSDRTEIRLDSNTIENIDIISSINNFVEYREEQTFFVDFYLNFGQNQTLIANNIKLETEEGIDPTVLIKLYEPLPSNFGIKDELWLVELLSNPQAYEVDFPFNPTIEDDFTYIAGPNYNLNIIGQTSTPSEQFSYNTLLNSDLTSSISQIQSLLNEKEINININYEDYSNFVNFSSAKTRLENFFYKIELIQSKETDLSSLTSEVTSNTTTTFAFSSSVEILSNQIDTIIKNFDGYEYFLYFNSGSDWSYPKFSSQPPYTLYSTNSTKVQTWITSSANSASAYDEENKDWLYWAIPEYLREDSANKNYELFVDMVGQYYDNVWTYTKDITNKFDADNRLDYGISKDLVADAIKDFAIKLYSNNFNTDDLFTAFLGITPSGSAFPFPYMTGSLPIESGYEYVDTKISASNDIVPLDDVNKSVYKRIYHNIPYLLKTKGTVAGLRALITSYGIPDTILRINEFGGKDRNESQDYDLKQDVFNYAFDTGPNSDNFISSSLDKNPLFPQNPIGVIGENGLNTVQFRFKSHGIPPAVNNVASSDIREKQLLWINSEATNDFTQIGSAVVLEYNGNGFFSGSYSGSIPSPYDTWGTLKLYHSLPASSFISIYLPFFNKDWWSVQINFSGSGSGRGLEGKFTLFAANEIDGKIGFSGSSNTFGADPLPWVNGDFGALNFSASRTIYAHNYEPFSGSFQELRYWGVGLSESQFFDYTVNPYSNEGNILNSTPDELFFRAALGTQLDTGSRTSIHPRITGSAIQITQSFTNDSSFYINNTSSFVTNIEDTFQDQVPSGIKNRITDKIKSENLIIAEAPYGFPNPTSSVPEISSRDNDTQTISAMESMQQNSFVSQSYTPNVNYLEVAFSPSNQINDDINAQLGYFNLGEFIGDPRFQSSSLYTYPDLDGLRNSYFEKYMDSYDIVDFVRLIKFFDNSLFKMIKDFTPARSSLASGVVVKQHILERNRQRPAQLTSSLHDYEGLVVNLPKDYSSGSSDFPQYSTSGSAIYKFSGGPGGSFNKFNSLKTYISGSDGNGPNNKFGITQSWQEDNDNSVLNPTNFNQSSSQYISGSYLGPRTWEKEDQSEFYDGIFSGSDLTVTTQSLNPGCEPYLNVVDTPLLYKPLFFSVTEGGEDEYVALGEFTNPNNIPPDGYAWIASEQTFFEGEYAGTQQVRAIKLSQNDVNGVEVINYLDDFSQLKCIFTDATIPYGYSSVEYVVEGRTIFSTHAVLNISQDLGILGNNYPQVVDGTTYYPITSSNQGGSMNWSLEAKTEFNTISSVSTQSSDNLQQNVLANPNIVNQEQNIFFWGEDDASIRQDFISDELGFFGYQGDPDINTNVILNPNGLSYTTSSYNIPYTPNIPWVISASIKYSSSNTPSVGGEDDGIYHSGSSYQDAGLTDQNFKLSNVSTSVRYFHINSTGESTAALADAATDPTVSDIKFYYDPVVLEYQNNTSIVYIDANLTIPATPSNFVDASTSLDPNFYKISNLTTDGGNLEYWVGEFKPSLILGEYVFTIADRSLYSNPNSGKSPVIGILQSVQASTLFRPAPRYVQDLGTVLFNGNNFNPLIPGNSGSGVDMNDFAGHPKIKQAGTASFDWTFPSLTLAGDIPTLGSGTSTFQPFSGSSAYAGNENFRADFDPSSAWLLDTVSFLDYTSGGGIPNMGEFYDGSVQLNWGDYNQSSIGVYGALIDAAGFDNIIQTFFFRISMVIEGANSSDSFEVQGYVQDWDPSGPALGLNQVELFSTPLTSTNGVINISNQTTLPINYNSNGLAGAGTEFSRILFKIKNTGTSNLSYSWVISNVVFGFSYMDSNLLLNNYLPATLYRGDSSESNRFQGTNSNQDSIVPVSNPDFYPQAVVDVYLKRTGSAGESTITGSTFATGGGYSGSVYSGSTLNFTGGVTGFTSIFDDTTGPNSTVNEVGDIYFIEYSASNFKSGQILGTPVNSQDFAFKTDSDLSRLTITQSIGSGGSQAFNSTGSLILRQSNTSNIGGTLVNNLLPIGNEVLNIPWNLDENADGTTQVNITGSFNGLFNHNDIFRFSIRNSKVGLGSSLFINELTASIFPSQSIYSPITEPFEYDNYRVPTDSGFIAPTYYPGSLPFSLALNCQPMLNNYSLGRFNPYLQDVDYNNESGPIIPINQELILKNQAVRAQTPVSNYTQISSINPKYDGVKSTSQQLNIWSIGDIGTFGKNPTVELKDAYFGYFNNISDPYPNINSLTKVNINYLIDEQGNALPPSLENQLSIDTFEQVFPNTTEGKLAIKDGDQTFSPLKSPSPINRIMQNVTPICYSQNSGNNYSKIIPLSGSGYISRYDNDDVNSITFGTFAAAGTSTVVDELGTNQQTINYYINPSSTNKSKDGANSAYTASGTFDSTGSASYPTTPWGTLGDDLNNPQVVSIQHSVVTSYVSETNRVRDELDLTFKMFTGSDENTQHKFNLEGIDCKVYTETGQVYLIKDVDNYGWFTYENLPSTTQIKKRKKGLSFKRYYYTRVPIPGGGIKCKVDWEMSETLFNLGLMRERRPKNGSGVVALEWIFKANSANYVIKAGDKISWKMEGSFKNSKSGYQQGYFFPNGYDGVYTPAFINGEGAQDYLLDEANTAQAPFWVFSESIARDNRFIVMSSSNFNEAYGVGFYQGDLPYQPGFSEYFPSNVEPRTTSFDPIENTLEFQEGDEIRFGNNESFTYKILEVFAPSENISSSAAGNFAQLKLRLDRPLDNSVNKDFFLIRRTIPNAQSLYLDMNFPYGILSSGSIFKAIKTTGSALEFGLTSSDATGSFPAIDTNGQYTASISEVRSLTTPGILYPDFPTEYLVQSASVIVNDLISKGIIES